MKYKDQKLYEIVGAFIQGIQSSPDQRVTQLLKMSLLSPPIPRTPYEWQSIIIKNLEQRDVLVTGATGGGKSLPVLVHWLKHYGYSNPFAPVDIATAPTAILDPTHIKHGYRMIWLTPFRSLNESVISDITRVLTSVVAYAIIGIIYSLVKEKHSVGERITPERLVQKLNTAFLFNYQETLGHNSIRDDVRNLLHFISSLDIDDQSFLTRILESRILQTVCQGYIQNMVIGNIYEGVNTSNITGTKITKPIVVSIYESSDKIDINLMQGLFVVFDEIQTVVVPYDNTDKDKVKRAEQIGIACSKILYKMRGYGRLAVLSGTLDPINAREIVDIIKEYKRPTIYCPDIEGRNPATIEVKEMDQLTNQNYVVKLIVNLLQLGKTNVAILIFSRNKIVETVQKVLREVQTKSIQQSNHPDISRLGDPLLKAAAIYGIGYIVRKTKSDPFFGTFGAEGQYMLKLSNEDVWYLIQNDNIIMQNLFVNRVIRILLVTDSIEAGVNLSISEMYITRFEKSGEQTLTDISKAQILNRVGRQPMTATIYVPTAYVGDVKRILSGGGEYFGRVYLPSPYYYVEV